MKKSIDITPDKTLIQKTGLVGYSTAEALAELVDNSIDARLGRVGVSLHLDFQGMRITISDDGRGMDMGGLRAAMTVARRTKPDGSLGQFGMGMKSACSALGGRFEIRTSAEGSPKEYSVSYDEEEWLSDGAAGWRNFGVTETDLAGRDDWHGTSIAIDRLKVPLYPNLATNLRKSFGQRYGSYIKDGTASVRVNRTLCKPFRPDVEKGTRIMIRIETRDGAVITGHVELLRARSVGGKYGIDLYRHGRLIKPHVKFGFPAHPENSLVTGRLDLDHVPVNFQKNDFIGESDEYREALRAFKDSGPASRILAMSRSRSPDTPSVDPVFEYFAAGSEPPRMRPGMSSGTSARVLGDARPFVVAAGGRRIRVLFESGGSGPLYGVSDDGGDRTVTINRDSASFSFVRNPLFLIGMIAAEAAAMPSGKGFADFVMARNRSVEESLRGLKAGRGPFRPRRRDIPIPDIPGYGLAGELVDLHDRLEEVADYRFQFTAMSTLVPYLHNHKGQIVYTVHAAPGRGGDLAGALTDMLDEADERHIIVINAPSRDTLAGLLANRGMARIIAVRENRSISGPTVAGPEKAVTDLIVESETYGIPVGLHEVGRILRGLVDDGLVDADRARRYARFRKRSGRLEELLAG
ncbi:MAG: ATP-binding protein [Alphaproteobacteria bacterium]|nr:ATP-binding protein [Alphaproteobacteria bacterium]